MGQFFSDEPDELDELMDYIEAKKKIVEVNAWAKALVRQKDEAFFLTAMSRRMNRNKWIVGILIAVLIIAIVLILYFKLVK